MMAFVGLRVRAELRSQWRTMMLVALTVALGGAVALTALAGARRAGSAMGEFVRYAKPDTGAVFFGNSPFEPPPVDGAAARSTAPPPYARPVLALPEVTDYARVCYLFTLTAGEVGTVNTFGSPDASFMHSVDRPLVVAGRLPDPNDGSAAVVNEFAARKLHLHVGSTLPIHARTSSTKASRMCTWDRDSCGGWRAACTSLSSASAA
jgi:hypothetical protein